MNPSHTNIQTQLNAFVAGQITRLGNSGLISSFFEAEKFNHGNIGNASNMSIVMMTPAAFQAKSENSPSVLSNAFVLTMSDFAKRVLQMLFSHERQVAQEFAHYLNKTKSSHNMHPHMTMKRRISTPPQITETMIVEALASIGINADDVRILAAAGQVDHGKEFYAHKMLQDTLHLAELAGRDSHIPVPVPLLEAIRKKGPSLHLYQAATRLASAPALSEKINEFARNSVASSKNTTPDMDDTAFEQALLRRVSTQEGIAELNKILDSKYCQISHNEMSEQELQKALGSITYSLNKIARQTPAKMEKLAQEINHYLGRHIPTQISPEKIFTYLKSISDHDRAQFLERVLRMFFKR